MSAITLTQISQPKPRRGRPNKYKGESEFYATVIPKGMKAEADEVIEKKFARFQSKQYKACKAKQAQSDQADLTRNTPNQ